MNAILDSLPQPDGSEFYRRSVVAALLRSKKPSTAALFRQSAAAADRARQALKRLAMAPLALGGVNAQSYASYARTSRLPLSYIRLLVAAATLADCAADELQVKVLSVEKRLARVEKAMKKEPLRVHGLRADFYRENAAAKRERLGTLSAVGRIDESGPMRFARKWVGEDGKVFFDCVCEAMGPSFSFLCRLSLDIY